GAAGLSGPLATPATCGCTLLAEVCDLGSGTLVFRVVVDDVGVGGRLGASRAVVLAFVPQADA
ncbi:hypothetical protein KBZ21_55585, partial [Streptomyces sp. A73]|nr:hypothetical protein [Streptomyces sp. A73]